MLHVFRLIESNTWERKKRKSKIGQESLQTVMQASAGPMRSSQAKVRGVLCSAVGWGLPGKTDLSSEAEADS